MDAKIMRLRLEQWMPIFEEQARSGLGKDEFCRTRGIKRWEFYKRQRECRKFLLENVGSGKALPIPLDNLPEFFELPSSLPDIEDRPIIENPITETSLGCIEITHGKFSMKLNGRVDRGTLQAVIEAVAHA